MTSANRRFKIHIRTTTLDYWSEAIEATSTTGALGAWIRRIEALPAPMRPSGPGDQGQEGWHLSVVSEESWPALEQELELILGDPPF